MSTKPAIQPLALLLLAAAAALAPVASAAAQERTSERNGGRPEVDYQLGPEDVIEVFVWKEPDLSTQVTVRPDGRITLPLAGELIAAGKTPQELQAEIASSLERYVEQPVVTVIVKAINSRQISVLGEVRRPGRYRISQRTDILDAIAMSGGFTEFADRKEVLILRKTKSGVRRMQVNVKRLLNEGAHPLYLEPGDTVYVD